MTAPTFADVKNLLDDLADTHDPDERKRVFGRHNPEGGFGWETEEDLLASYVLREPYANTRLIDPSAYWDKKPEDLIGSMKYCPLVYMLANQRMPRILPGTNRRYATKEEIEMLIDYVFSLLPKKP